MLRARKKTSVHSSGTSDDDYAKKQLSTRSRFRFRCSTFLVVALFLGVIAHNRFARRLESATELKQQIAATSNPVGNVEDKPDPAVSEVAAPVFDKNACVAAIHAATNPLVPIVPSMLSREKKVNVRDTMINAVLNPDLVGDWVETGTWKGGASLIAAVVQRTAQETPACGVVRRRAIWLADSFEGLPLDAANEAGGYSKKMDAPGSYKIEGGVDEVKTLFATHGFQTDGSGEVAVHFLQGWFKDTLPNSKVRDIAVLRLDGDLYSSTLQALFALYRRVRLGGFVIIDDYGHCPQCARAVDEFFVDSSLNLTKIDYTGRWFQKNNTQVRVPPDWNDQIELHPKVNDAMTKLQQWHERIKRKFVGNVVDNKFQASRYIEALLHLGENKMDRINVCETGFNGGHSAMLFLAFNSTDIAVHYYGWDLGAVGAAKPIASRMNETFPGQFNIVWGSSVETLKNASLGHDEQGRELKCHLIVVDGAHHGPGVDNDLKNFLRMAAPGAVVFGDDCAPPNNNVPRAHKMLAAWNRYVTSGQLVPVANYQNPQLGSPGFVEGIVPGPNGEYELGL